MPDIKIEINNKEINLTFEEGEILLEELYNVFSPQDPYIWEKLEGIPSIYEILEQAWDLEENVNWFKSTSE